MSRAIIKNPSELPRINEQLLRGLGVHHECSAPISSSSGGSFNENGAMAVQKLHGITEIFCALIAFRRGSLNTCTWKDAQSVHQKKDRESKMSTTELFLFMKARVSPAQNFFQS